MKFIHLSDLHIGKKLEGFSLYDDQKDILKKITAVIAEERPDCVLIAGDVYDHSVPQIESVQLFYQFLKDIKALAVPVLAVSGNHDSAERLGFGAAFMGEAGMYFSESFTGADSVRKVRLSDAFGPVNIYLLPFLKPADVRHAYHADAGKITSYHEAVAYVIERLALDKKERNVLVAHQFVTGAVKCGSEKVTVGGIDNIGGEVFEDFDYVALGHVHKYQNVPAGNERIHYSGTPLKYTFDDKDSVKSLTVVELGAKGETPQKRRVKLTPLRELRREQGTYEELMLRERYESLPKDPKDNLPRDFFHITLTDEQDVPDALLKLSCVYKNLAHLEYANKRTSFDQEIGAGDEESARGPLDLARELYAWQNNDPMSEKQEKLLAELIAKLEEERA